MAKVYISGKITGLSNYHELFNQAESELKQKGHTVINPVNLRHDHDKTWQSYMKEDIKHLMDCNTIYMLKNWMQSDGARIERAIADNLKYEIIYQ